MTKLIRAKNSGATVLVYYATQDNWYNAAS